VREKAAKFALAPGWLRSDTFFACPWHRAPREVTADMSRCTSCGKDVTSGMYKLCPTCAARQGKCRYKDCKRAVGPATRGVTLRLEAYSPLNKTRLTPQQREDAARRIVRVRPGRRAGAFLHVEGTAKQVPELMCWTRPHHLGTCQTLFFLVKAKGAPDALVVFPEFNRKYYRNMTHNPNPRLKPFSDLTQWKWFTLSAKDPRGRPVCAAPGTYSVRAVAGRLVSNPVMVVVE
jgi:hypothetical protein